MKFLIIGRTSSGKSTLGKILELSGYKGVKSYTTRPQRNENDTDHIFITKEEAANFTNKTTETVINGYEYFSTKDQIEASDFYIIDPIGTYTILENMPDETFLILYIKAKDEDRKAHFMKRENATEEDYEKRNSSEKAQFDEFEEKLNKLNGSQETMQALFSQPNLGGILPIENSYELLFDLYHARSCIQSFILSKRAILETIQNKGSKHIQVITRNGIQYMVRDDALGPDGKPLEVNLDKIVLSSMENTEVFNEFLEAIK